MGSVQFYSAVRKVLTSYTQSRQLAVSSGGAVLTTMDDQPLTVAQQDLLAIGDGTTQCFKVVHTTVES